MDYKVLWIVSFCMMAFYISLGGYVLGKYRSILDPFMKSNIIIYLVAFTAKPIFWLACYWLELYNIQLSDTTQPLVPIRSTLGSAISAMCFLIIHILIIRIVLAYYLLKLESAQEKQVKAKGIMHGMYIHVIGYLLLVSILIYLDYANDQRLD